MVQIYLLFAFNQWYPCGGVNDFRGVFSSLEAAESAFNGDVDEAQVALIDGDQLVIVSEGWGRPNSTPRIIQWTRTPSAGVLETNRTVSKSR